MATGEMPMDRLYTPPSGRPKSADDGDDDDLLLYLYGKSSDSRSKCYDCISMGGLASRSPRDSSEAVPESDKEALSRSTEQICSKTLSLAGSAAAAGVAPVHGVVRSCRSQENYFELSDMICVDIDIDENLASSVDALHYRESVFSTTSDSSGSVEIAELESADQNLPATSPEDKKPDEIVQQCSTLDTPSSDEEVPTSIESEPPSTDEVPPASAIDVEVGCDDNDAVDGGGEGKVTDDVAAGVDGEVQTRLCLKDADRPSAARLAKRLYHLDGFRKMDVSPHLTKNKTLLTLYDRNSFSQLVGEEFLKYFDFTGESLDVGLRRFLHHLTVSGDSQECDRLLGHFSHRYHHCNPAVHQSEDSCHTLVCAMLLLNANLNCQKNSGGPRTMTLSEFITNLSLLNNGEDFPRDVLKSIYMSLKHQPLPHNAGDDSDLVAGSTTNQQPISPETYITQTMTLSTASTNRVTSSLATNVNNASSSSSSSSSTSSHISRPQGMKQISAIAAFKKGYIMRKCCVEPDGRKTPLGKRCWKMYYMILRDTVLSLYTDENCYKRSTLCTNTIHLQHALATKAADYTKKKHVFRLQTADLAQYLIQTSDVRECDDWIEAINLIAAFYSPPVFRDDSSPNSSYRRCFHRTVAPASNTPINLSEQVAQHELMVSRYERQLSELRLNQPDRTIQPRQLQDFSKLESYVKFELKRYKTYVRLLRVKTAAALRETDARLVNPMIGELDGENPVTSSPETTHRLTSRKTPLPAS